MGERLAIGVDLGATKIATALVTARGRLLASRQTPTCANEGPAAVLDRIASEIQALLSQADQPVAGIGIGTPGIVNPSEGVVRNAVNLGWNEVPLVKGILSRLALDLPVWIQKDTNASALGEYYFGAAQGCHDFVYLSVGSGLGGGIISNGEIITGAGWQASELGHISLDPKGRLCPCGLHGCAETIVSGPGLLTLTREYLSQGKFPTSLRESAMLTPADTLNAARAGDPLALAVFDDVGANLGIIMGICVAVLNPAMFVVGGGLGLVAFDLIVPAAHRELELRVLPSGYQDLRIVASSQISSAVGPSSLVWYGMKDTLPAHQPGRYGSV